MFIYRSTIFKIITIFTISCAISINIKAFFFIKLICCAFFLYFKLKAILTIQIPCILQMPVWMSIVS